MLSGLGVDLRHNDAFKQAVVNRYVDWADLDFSEFILDEQSRAEEEWLDMSRAFLETWSRNPNLVGIQELAELDPADWTQAVLKMFIETNFRHTDEGAPIATASATSLDSTKTYSITTFHPLTKENMSDYVGEYLTINLRTRDPSNPDLDFALGTYHIEVIGKLLAVDENAQTFTLDDIKILIVEYTSDNPDVRRVTLDDLLDAIGIHIPGNLLDQVNIVGSDKEPIAQLGRSGQPVQYYSWFAQYNLAEEMTIPIPEIVQSAG